MLEGLRRISDLITQLRGDPSLYDEAPAPHPLAHALTLPDGTAAPEMLRVWAAFDERYPWPFSSGRSTQAIARADGVVIAKSMREVLRWVCLESVAGELADDADTLDYLRDLVEDFAEEMPGWGVVLEPPDHPDRVLWFAIDGTPTLLWYEHDAFDRREPFVEWLESLFNE